MTPPSNKRLDYENRLKSNPSDQIFAELAEVYIKESKFIEAIDTCLLGLTYNPKNTKGRLALARAYYEKGYFPFALNELLILKNKFPESKYLARLVDKLTPQQLQASNPDAKEETHAELDLGGDEMKALFDD